MFAFAQFTPCCKLATSLCVVQYIKPGFSSYFLGRHDCIVPAVSSFVSLCPCAYINQFTNDTMRFKLFSDWCFNACCTHISCLGSRIWTETRKFFCYRKLWLWNTRAHWFGHQGNCFHHIFEHVMIGILSKRSKFFVSLFMFSVERFWPGTFGIKGPHWLDEFPNQNYRFYLRRFQQKGIF